MVQIERQGFGDNGYDGSILFKRKIFTERIEGVCICHMVCQQLDGVAVLRRVQCCRERGVCAAVRSVRFCYRSGLNDSLVDREFHGC